MIEDWDLLSSVPAVGFHSLIELPDHVTQPGREVVLDQQIDHKQFMGGVITQTIKQGRLGFCNANLALYHEFVVDVWNMYDISKLALMDYHSFHHFHQSNSLSNWPHQTSPI